MKKIATRWISVLAVAVILAAMLTGCGGNDSRGDNVSATGNGSGGEKTMAILMHSVADEFIYSVGKKAQEYAEEQGYTVSFYHADNVADTQASQINDVLAMGVDCIILAPVDADALSDSVAAINEANIPVTLIDRTVTEAEMKTALDSILEESF